MAYFATLQGDPLYLFTRLSVEKCLANAIGPTGTVKGGYTTTLTVRIPKRRNHPFWLLDVTQPDEKLFTWDVSEDTLSFEVTRWGAQDDYSSFYATQRAKDIIENIRAAVLNPTHLHSCIFVAMPHALNHSLHSRRVLGLGRQLNTTWKYAKLAFSTVCHAQTVDSSVNFIQDIIDSNTLPGLSPLLKYYQV